MLSKIVFVFLLVMVVIGMIGKALAKPGRNRPLPAAKCPRCGRFRIGRGPCGQPKPPEEGTAPFEQGIAAGLQRGPGSGQ